MTWTPLPTRLASRRAGCVRRLTDQALGCRPAVGCGRAPLFSLTRGYQTDWNEWWPVSCSALLGGGLLKGESEYEVD